MSLFEEPKEKDAIVFPTHPAFVVPVEVREVPSLGKGHMGVFATVQIPKGTQFWVWTDRITQIHHSELKDYIDTHFADDLEQTQVFLRQGFVLPSTADKPDKDAYFYSNPTDAGRFMNHSSKANCGPDGTTRDVDAGEELTMDYSFHGNPQWYMDICHSYGVLTEAQVAEMYS
jgi:SET domain-containing protein